jgi:hypothetical protein
MSETLARLLAAELKMVPYHSGGNHWVVKGRDDHGNVVAIDHQGVGVYSTEVDFEEGNCERGVWFAS